MFLVGDFVNVMKFFGDMFANFVNLLSIPINFGPFYISVFQVFFGLCLLGLVVAVIKRIYD